MKTSADFPQPSQKDVGETTSIDPTLQGLRIIAEISSQGGRVIDNICYPGCGSDGTPSVAIPEATTTYIYPSEDTTKGLLKREKDLFFCLKLEDYRKQYPDKKFDLVYLLNSYAPMLDSVDLVRNGGIVVVNNWLGHATEFTKTEWEESGLRLVGVVVSSNGSVRYEDKTPRDSLTPVENERELNNFVAQLDRIKLEFSEKSFAFASPTVIRSIFDTYHFQISDGEDIVTAYKRFCLEYRNKKKEKSKIAGLPENLELQILIKRPDGKSTKLPDLPPKMANAYLWVFEKK